MFPESLDERCCSRANDMTTVDAGAPVAPTPKKQKISQFRRLLWHVNRTDLGWVTKTALTGMQLGARAKRVEILKTLPTAATWAEASRKLAEDGYIDVTSLVDRNLAEAVAAVSDNKVARLNE